MRKWIFAIFLLGLTLGVFDFVLAQDPIRNDISNGARKIEVDFFYSPTCPHCAKEKEFLKELELRHPEIKINRYDVINSQDSQKLLKDFYEKYGVPAALQGLVPVTFTPVKYFVGFDDKVAEEIENCLEQCFKPDDKELSLTHTSIIEKNLKIPFLGEIQLSRFSFPVMAIVLGTLDGFNVCSLGALVLILSLVLALNSRKKIMIFGGVFLLTTAAVYGFLIFFWYKLFETVAPYLQIMNVLIGVLGIAGGVYFFRQFLKFRSSSPTCESKPGEKISAKFFPKLQNLFKTPSSILLAIGSIFAFALVLTVVEFPCSAVVPVAFAAVLAQAGLSSALYIFYIAIFVLFYLLDEIIVFLLAVFTSKIWLTSPRFLKWIILAEAIILFFLGFYYLL